MGHQGTLAWPLDRAVAQFGDREAIVDGPTRRSWAEVGDRVARLGGGLMSSGLRPGDRIAILSANSAAYLELAMGVPRVGMVTNALNTRLGAAELEFIVADSEAVAIAVDAAHVELGRSLCRACGSLRLLIRLDAVDAVEAAAEGGLNEVDFADLVRGPAAPAREVEPDTLAAISYTGGTTGRPKGVMLSHRNLLENAKHMLATLPFTADDRYLHAPPMFHAADAMMIFALTWVGATHVVIDRFEPVAVLEAIAAERITLIVLVPTMINMTISHPTASTADLSSMRLLLYGASPMPDGLRRRAREVFRCGWAQLYGMTEAAPVVSILGPDDHERGADGGEPHARRLRGAGAPAIGVQAEVRREDGSRADPDEAGEVWVRGPNVMLGYWRRPEETAAALVDGWFRTGDMAVLGRDGHLTIVDRTRDMIISGGENVYSTEVEHALYEHPTVMEAAVIGVADDLWVERVHAIVVLRTGATVSTEELRDHCRRYLAGYKVPRTIEIRTEPLPKSGAGKILKRALRAQDPNVPGA